MPEKLIAGYQRFRSEYFYRQQDVFKKLAAGQAPYAAMISCCDSRVDPTIIFDASPGEIFVIRNVANLVPPCEKDSAFHGTSAALEFAVTYLHVQHVVVLGHAGCGGIRALVEPTIRNSDNSFIGRWMSIADKARQAVLARHDLSDNDARAAACEKLSIQVSLANLLTYPWIRNSVERGALRLHGWFFDLSSADLLRLEPSMGEFIPAFPSGTNNGDE